MQTERQVESFWLSESKKMFEETVRLRRAIHREPELAFEETRTADKIVHELRPLGLKLRQRVAQTGVIADLEVDSKAPWIALRADMDALPMTEETGLEFSSAQPGRAHMCGHDGHVAMLVGAAKLLVRHKNRLKTNVRFFFQPSEEKPPGGAPQMIEEGVLDGMDRVYGIHVSPDFPAGTLATRSGPLMAQSDRFEIVVTGKGGHGSKPRSAVDPVVVAAEIILALQTIPSRKATPADPIVVSVCRVSGGEAFNVIPERVSLQGTSRTVTKESAGNIEGWIRRVCEGVASAHGAKADLEYIVGYPPLVNHPEGEAAWKSATETLLGPDRFISCEPTLYGEDFAYYTQKLPGAFAFLGVGWPELEKYQSLHSSRFVMNEEGLLYGPALFAQLAEGSYALF